MPGRVEIEVFSQINHVVGGRRKLLEIGNFRRPVRPDGAVLNRPEAWYRFGTAARLQGIEQLCESNLSFASDDVIDKARFQTLLRRSRRVRPAKHNRDPRMNAP